MTNALNTVYEENNVTQIVTLDKAFLDEEPIGHLGKSALGALDIGLHLVLGLAC